MPQEPDPNGEWAVLLCAVAVGAAYPITQCAADFPPGPYPTRSPQSCMFYGRGFKRGCDTHIVAVEEPDFLVARGSPSGRVYHELVSSQDAQVLPLAVVYFVPSP